MTKLSFPAFIYEVNGIVTLSDGTGTVTFESAELFTAAVPDFALPAGVIGISYEKRGNHLIHVRHKEGGGIEKVEGPDAELDAIIAQAADLAIVREAQNHLLYGITDVAKARSLAVEQVDADAETERLKYITPGSGQAMVYREKREEANALKQAIAAGETIAAADYPHLAKEVGITATDLEAVADGVLAESASWKVISSEIEAVRLQAKKNIAAATDVDGVKVVFDNVIWPEFGA